MQQLSSWVIRLESERESYPALTSPTQDPPLTQIGLQSHKHTAGQKSDPIIATRNAAWFRTGPRTEDWMAGKHSTREARQHLQSIVVVLSSCSFHTGLNHRYGTLIPQRQTHSDSKHVIKTQINKQTFRAVDRWSFSEGFATRGTWAKLLHSFMVHKLRENERGKRLAGRCLVWFRKSLSTDSQTLPGVSATLFLDQNTPSRTALEFPNSAAICQARRIGKLSWPWEITALLSLGNFCPRYP